MKSFFEIVFEVFAVTVFFLLWWLIGRPSWVLLTCLYLGYHFFVYLPYKWAKWHGKQ